MRRESHLHGRFFWLRPALIELFWLFGLPSLYWWEVETGGQLGAGQLDVHQWRSSLHATFLSNSNLFFFMTIATLIASGWWVGELGMGY